MKKISKKAPEIEKIESVQTEQKNQSTRVNVMEDLVHNFDVEKILALNEKLRSYYEKKGDAKTLELLDRMTLAMNELSEIIEQVKAKRISLEQGQKEIQEKLREVNEVLQLMNDWEATGL